MRNLQDLNQHELIEFFESFEFVFIDFDGVLTYMGKSIRGACEALKKLQSLRKKLFIVSNNTLLTLDEFYDKLCSIGYAQIFTKNQIICPTLVIIDVLKNIQFSEAIYLLGPQSMKFELEKAGFSIVTNSIKNFESLTDLKSELASDNDRAAVGAIIIDYDINLNYFSLQKIVNFARTKNLKILAGSSTWTLPISRTQQLIGPGQIQHIFEHLAEKSILKCGKPFDQMAKFLRQFCQYSNPMRVLLIGDSLDDDIRFANVSGFQSVLVLSGNCDRDTFLAAQPSSYNIRPDYYLDDLSRFSDLIAKL